MRLFLLCLLLSLMAGRSRSDSVGGDEVAKAAMCSAHARRIKVMSYNILYGGEGDSPGRLDRIKAWLRSTTEVDVVALQECNGWQNPPTTLAEECGFTHHELLTCETGYHISVMSRRPLVVVRKEASPSPGFHHGLLEVEVLGVRFLATHLTPRSSSSRLGECELISRRCKELTEEGRPVVVLGDLNTLSPLDDEAYGDVAEELLKDERLQRKFLRSSDVDDASEHGENARGENDDERDREADGKKRLKKPQVDYRPMNVLLGGGLVDLAVSTEEAYSAEGTAPGGGDAGERVSKLRGLLGGKTVPTVLDADEMHATTMRLDYMLGNRFVQVLRPAAAVIGPETDFLSDHYPIIAEIEIGGDTSDDLKCSR